jgi:hypothetical protein
MGAAGCLSGGVQGKAERVTQTITGNAAAKSAAWCVCKEKLSRLLKNYSRRAA